MGATFALDGRLYAAGGAEWPGGGGGEEEEEEEEEEEGASDAFEAFCPRTGRWERLPPLPAGRANLAVAVVFS